MTSAGPATRGCWPGSHAEDLRGARSTPAAALVHDCQVLTETLYPEVFDTVVDTIFTPTRTIEVSNPHKPECGIVWDLLDPVMYDTIPPLQELRAMESGLPARG